MGTTYKPLLAYNKPYEVCDLVYPLYASAKLDGIRATVLDGNLVSRTLKPIPNHHTRGVLSNASFSGFDGELMIGSPVSPTAYRDTVSGIMREDGLPDFTYYVFDDHTIPSDIFSDRLISLKGRVGSGVDIRVLDQVLLSCEADLLAFEAVVLGEGYEGVILRSPTSMYKYGRSTFKDSAAIKLKRFSQDEAVIVNIVELQTNMNIAFENELGRTARSSHQENMVGAGVMGAIEVRDVLTGVEFSIGTGFNAKERAHFWDNRESIVGKVVTYQHFPIGAYDKPRFPSYKGFRSDIDM